MIDGPYNPLDKLHFGDSIARAFLASPVHTLSVRSHLVGAGVYALYYTGDFPPYAPIAQANRKDQFAQPIYVGKAVPEGARKGRLMDAAATGTALRKRLGNHAGSIREVENLNVEDFQFRSLVVDDVWIPLGEAMLIRYFKPIWNVVIDGFGNNTPGTGRNRQGKSRWDILHPGRKRAALLPDGDLTPSDVVSRLNAHFEGKQVAPLLEEVETNGDEDS